MITHNLIQGTPEWHAYRAQHFNASDAPAMLGCSPYKTRAELIQETATGIGKEIDAFTQKIFDDGHRYEALARPLAEKIIGEDLYPVTGSEGKYSASFDGLTLDEAIGFEHKSLNDELRAAMVDGCTGADLPKVYRVQMEQQCMVSGAGSILFIASKWDGDVLAEARHCWYTPDLALRAEIVAGWEQFEADVAAYVPLEQVEKPVVASILELPTLVVQTRGEVVQSNLPVFKVAARAFIDGIKTDLSTDEDFANAEATVKFCEETEGKLEHAKAAALAQTSSIDEVLRTVDHIREQIRSKRLHLAGLIDTKKKQIKEGKLAAGKVAYAEHLAELERELSPLRLAITPPDFAAAMKGKRTLATLQNAVDTTLAQAKITANAVAQDWRNKLAWFNSAAAEYKFLFNDLQAIISKGKDDFELLVNSRIATHKADEAAKAEALRAQIAAEERANAEAAQAIKQANQTAAQANVAATHSAAATANVAANAAAAGIPVTSSPAIFDAADDAIRITDPTDEQILEVMLDAFEMTAAQAIMRLERFDGAVARQIFGLPAAGEPNITMIEVDSSQIAAIGHDPKTNTLAIRFPAKKGPGSLYHYKNFTADLFEQFKNAESIGSFFGKNIKPFADKYPYEKVAA